MLFNEDFNQAFRLGMPSMDATHQEFVDLVNQLMASDNQQFPELFKALQAHTEAHFEAENRLMADSGFPAIAEHKGEHQRVLGELNRFASRLSGPGIQMARAYVREQIPGWFKLHLMTMDSALAAHLNRHQVAFAEA